MIDNKTEYHRVKVLFIPIKLFYQYKRIYSEKTTALKFKTGKWQFNYRKMENQKISVLGAFSSS